MGRNIVSQSTKEGRGTGNENINGRGRTNPANIHWKNKIFSEKGGRRI